MVLSRLAVGLNKVAASGLAGSVANASLASPIGGAEVEINLDVASNSILLVVSGQRLLSRADAVDNVGMDIFLSRSNVCDLADNPLG